MAAGFSNESGNSMDQTIEQEEAEPKSKGYGRPIEIEEFSNRFFVHPLSDHVVRICIKAGISANAVSIAGLVCGLLAAFAYTQTPDIFMVLSGFSLMICWHILDGADGRLARVTGTSSAFGRIIDGICDHLVYAAVYIALAFNLMAGGYGAGVWWLVIGAGLSHAIQAAGYEERRQKYQRRREGIDRQTVANGLLSVDGNNSFLAGVYDLAQKLVAGGDYGLDGALKNLRRLPDNRQPPTIVIGQTAKMVKSWSVLNANNRTMLIFLFCLTGVPEFYFIFELIVFNIVLISLIFAERQFEKQLVRSIERP